MFYLSQVRQLQKGEQSSDFGWLLSLAARTLSGTSWSPSEETISTDNWIYMSSLSCPTQLSRLHITAYWMALVCSGASQTEHNPATSWSCPCHSMASSPIRYLGQKPTCCPWLFTSGLLTPKPLPSPVGSVPPSLHLCGSHLHLSPAQLHLPHHLSPCSHSCPWHSVLPRTSGMIY